MLIKIVDPKFQIIFFSQQIVLFIASKYFTLHPPWNFKSFQTEYVDKNI